MASNVATVGGSTATYNLSASTVVKATGGRLVRVCVVTAGSAAGAMHDCKATGDAAAGNKIATIPNTVGVYEFNWPCATGITYIVGTGQVVSVSYQ